MKLNRKGLVEEDLLVEVGVMEVEDIRMGVVMVATTMEDMEEEEVTAMTEEVMEEEEEAMVVDTTTVEDMAVAGATGVALVVDTVTVVDTEAEDMAVLGDTGIEEVDTVTAADTVDQVRSLSILFLLFCETNHSKTSIVFWIKGGGGGGKSFSMCRVGYADAL